MSESSRPPRWTVHQRNLRDDSGAFARYGFDCKPAANHLQSFSHAEQSQSFAFFGVQHEFLLKALAVVFYFQANGAVQFLDLYMHAACVSMTGDIGERFLSNPKQHGSFVTIHLLYPGKG